MINFRNVTFTYAGAARPVLRGVDLEIPEGELCVLLGRTGCGKSTLLKAVNGLVPHFTGGTLEGQVLVAGRDTRTHPPRELADVVGFVQQDPMSSFVADQVEDELAYSMESLALPEAVMRKRVEETLDLLGIAALRHRALSTLSGGERQRVAIGAALTAHPQVLVLDEPTSALDPGAAEDVLSAVHRLVHDLGITVLLAEHRLERVVQYADSVIWLPGDGAVPVIGPPGQTLAHTPIAPPVVRLGMLAGWDSPPVSVREARRRAAPLREQFPQLAEHDSPPPPPHLQQPGALAVAEKVTVRHGGISVVNRVDLTVSAGERVALMGRNGAGKSSLLWALQGSGPRQAGTIHMGDEDPAAVRSTRRRQLIGLVPQEPMDLIYLDTVGAECAQADRESGAASGACRALLDQLTPGIADDTHPRDLSEGQRLALAIAVVAAGTPPLLALDEPTRGLDYPAKRALTRWLQQYTEAGNAALVTTHDVEFVAEFATRVIVLADGEIVADGPAADVVTSSPLYAPQMSKVFAPHHPLTVEDVATALNWPGPGDTSGLGDSSPSSGTPAVSPDGAP